MLRSQTPNVIVLILKQFTFMQLYINSTSKDYFSPCPRHNYFCFGFGSSFKYFLSLIIQCLTSKIYTDTNQKWIFISNYRSHLFLTPSSYTKHDESPFTCSQFLKSDLLPENFYNATHQDKHIINIILIKTPQKKSKLFQTFVSTPKMYTVLKY